MKIIFVGMHNKQRLKPLDSKSQTGIAVDGIIEHIVGADISGVEFQKTNLCDSNCQPQPHEMDDYVGDYLQRVPYDKGDVFVLLGNFVKSFFPQLTDAIIIKLAHPASIHGSLNRNEYVRKSALAIKSAIKTKP